MNNNATMPSSTYEYHLEGEEVMATLNVSTTTTGQVIYNVLVGPQSVARLRIMSGAFQRIDWKKASIRLVALNGSVVTSGYTMGFVEDPELQVPSTPSAVLPFLTALRKTTVRQAWVESESGLQVSVSDKPEMYTQLGSDVRRFSPGRIVIATTGNVGTNTTFMVMLRYKVRLFVPLAITNEANEISSLNAFQDVTVATNNVLQSSPWTTSSVAQGQVFRLDTNMGCLDVSRTQPERRIRIISAGSLVTLGLASPNYLTVTMQGGLNPPGETLAIADWNDAAKDMIPMTSVPGQKWGWTGTET